jgi:hypothetical protein
MYSDVLSSISQKVEAKISSGSSVRNNAFGAATDGPREIPFNKRKQFQNEWGAVMAQ